MGQNVPAPQYPSLLIKAEASRPAGTRWLQRHEATHRPPKAARIPSRETFGLAHNFGARVGAAASTFLKTSKHDNASRHSLGSEETIETDATRRRAFLYEAHAPPAKFGRKPRLIGLIELDDGSKILAPLLSVPAIAQRLHPHDYHM